MKGVCAKQAKHFRQVQKRNITVLPSQYSAAIRDPRILLSYVFFRCLKGLFCCICAMLRTFGPPLVVL